MKFFFRSALNLLVLAVAVLVSVMATGQSSPVVSGLKPRPKAQPTAAMVLVVRVVPDKNGPAVEIISTRPLVPQVQELEGPPRLVIDLPNTDLPNTNNSLRQKQANFQLGAFRSDPVRGVRIDQYQNRPPVTRVVIDLLKNSEYTWDLAGNLLTVRVHSAEEIAAKTLAVTSLTTEAQPVVVPVSSGGSGVAVSLNRFAGGSTITAGSETQILSLGRGGEVRVCPGTALSVTTSSNGQDLLFGISTGAFEAHYVLQSSADAILTPDFRILLEGPGEFHYAMSADSRGNTCLHALPGNSASAMVSELIGDDKYEVKPGEQVIFRSGRLAAMDTTDSSDCGCPAPSLPVMRASSSEAVHNEDSSDPVHLAQPGVMPSPVSMAEASSETAPLPLPEPPDSHIRIEAPLVFRASDFPASEPAAKPEVHGLPGSDSTVSTLLPATGLPAPSPQTQSDKSHHGFFGKVKGFFAAIFH